MAGGLGPIRAEHRRSRRSARDRSTAGARELDRGSYGVFRASLRSPRYLGQNLRRGDPMKLRRFNSDGITAFRDYRARLVIEPILPPPVQLLEDAAYTEVVADTEVPSRAFATRLEAGRFFEGLLDAANILSPERDQGLWAWLTLFYFDEVCPPDANGRRDPKTDEARLIPSLDNYQRFYRHLLLGPFLIVRAHRDQPDRAIGMLMQSSLETGRNCGTACLAQGARDKPSSGRSSNSSLLRCGVRFLQTRCWSENARSTAKTRGFA